MSVICITRTHSRILFALESEGNMTPAEVAEFWSLKTHKWVSRCLRELLAAGIVRVAAWHRNADGKASPVYSITPGQNAKRPKAEGYAVWSKRYRKKIKSNGGEQYMKARNSLALLVGITSGRV